MKQKEMKIWEGKLVTPEAEPQMLIELFLFSLFVIFKFIFCCKYCVFSAVRAMFSLTY